FLTFPVKPVGSLVSLLQSLRYWDLLGVGRGHLRGSLAAKLLGQLSGLSFLFGFVGGPVAVLPGPNRDHPRVSSLIDSHSLLRFSQQVNERFAGRSPAYLRHPQARHGQE